MRRRPQDILPIALGDARQLATENVTRYTFKEFTSDAEQRRQMRRFAGCARYVYNKALALEKELYEKKEKASRFQLDTSKPFSTSTVPIRISLRSAPLSRSFTRKDCGIRSVSRIRSASS
jgi:hypothetical protein